MHDRTLPVDALRELRQTFDRLLVVTHNGLRELVTPSDDIRFLHENATTSPVSDLLCGFRDDARVDRAVEQFQAPPDLPVETSLPGAAPVSPSRSRSSVLRLLDRRLPQASRRWLLAPVLAELAALEERSRPSR